MKKISLVIPQGDAEIYKKLEVLESLGNKRNKIEAIIEAGPNPSANRNRGVKKAKGEFIAFVNSHTILTENWEDEVTKFFKDYPQIDIVGGPQLTPKNENLFVRASGHALSSVFATANTAKRYKTTKLKLNAGERDLTSANLICKKKVLEKVKFDESLWPGEDPKFIIDAKKAGFKTAYSPNIVVYHKRRKNFSELIKQIFNYALVRSGNLKNTILRNPLFLIPSIFIIYITALPTLIMINAMSAIPLVLYFVLNILFSMYEGIKNKDIASFFLMPFIFLTIHISYGLGLISGLFKK